MNERINIEKTIKELKTSEFFLSLNLPMGYNAGLPILQVRNGSLCLLIPYLKYKVTGKVDETLVFPIRYAVALEMPENRPVEFVNLEFEKQFSKIDFSKAIGLFRHDSIKHLTKNEYAAKRSELLGMYDKLSESLLYGTEFTSEDENNMRELLSMLIEPSLLPMYKALDKEFYNKFIKA